MNGRGRGRGSNRASTNPEMQTLRRRLANMESRVQGRKVNPAPNPPCFVEVPWNDWTFERLETTTEDLQNIDISVAGITQQIRGRLGIESTATIWLKVQSAYVWATSAGPDFVTPDVEVSFYEVQGEPSAQHARSVQRDKGTLNMPARCGFIYPINDSREILGNTSERALNILRATASASGTNVTLRVHVLYQSNSA